jgi:hypothetical protein
MCVERCRKYFTYISILTILCLLISGCSWFNKQAKPDPLAQPEGSDQELSYLEKVKRPPLVFFDLEGQIETLFKPLNKMDFSAAQEEYQKTKTLWEKSKTEAGNIKGVKETDAAFNGLGSAIAAQKGPESLASLNKFTNSLNQLLMNYKLSPLSDIVTLATISRNISWQLEDQDFKKSQVRAEELKKTWESSKVNLEQPGIFGEITKAHDSVGKIKGAVTAENKMAADDQIKKFNESMTKIRNFYREKNASIMP